MTQYEPQRLADIKAKNVLAPVSDTTFLLDLIRKMENTRLGLTGIGPLAGPAYDHLSALVRENASKEPSIPGML